LRDRLYFVGIYKLPLTIRGDFLVVQTGQNHWERFADYIKKNEQRLKDKLTVLSLKNERLTLLRVIENLVTKKGMDGLNQSMVSGNMSMSSKVSQLNRSIMITQRSDASANSLGFEQSDPYGPRKIRSQLAS